jgi:hypothetical protein
VQFDFGINNAEGGGINNAEGAGLITPKARD